MKMEYPLTIYLYCLKYNSLKICVTEILAIILSIDICEKNWLGTEEMAGKIAAAAKRTEVI